MKHKHSQAGSIPLILVLGLLLIVVTSLGYVLWKDFGTQQNSHYASNNPSSQKMRAPLLLSFWNVQLPLTYEDSEFVTDTYSFAGTMEFGGYGISIKGGSGCIATPDYVATIVRVKSDTIITKPTNPLTNTSEIEDHYGKNLVSTL